MQKQGYDGVYHEAAGIWVAFEPNQVKSATDNIGTFDGENDDILFSVSSSGDGGDAKRVMPNGEEEPSYDKIRMAPVASAEKMLRGGVKFGDAISKTGISLREIALDGARAQTISVSLPVFTVTKWVAGMK